MATIPQRMRRPLSSSVVGTPGVDTSNVQILRQLSQTTGRLSVVSQRRDQQRQVMSDRRQGFVNRTDTNVKMVDFSRQLNSIGASSQNQNEYDEQTSALLNEFLGGIDNDQSRAQFSSMAGAKMQAKGDRFFVKNEQRKVEQIGENINIGVEGILEEVSETMGDSTLNFGDKMFLFSEQMADAEVLVQDAQGALSDAAFRDFQGEKSRAMATEAVMSLLDSNPDQVEPFLDAIEATNVFSKEDVGKIIDQANQYKRKQTELRNRTQAVNGYTLEGDLADRALGPQPPTESEINTLLVRKKINSTQAKAIRDIKKSKSNVFKGTNPLAYTKLIDEYAALQVLQRTEPVLSEIEENEDVQLFFAQLSRFRQRTLEAHQEGVITDGQVKSILGTIQPAFEEGVENIIDEIIEKKGIITRARTEFWSVGTFPFSDFENVRIFEDDDPRIADVRMRMMNDLMVAIDKEENQNGRISVSRAHELIGEVKEDFKLTVSSDQSRYKVGQILNRSNGKVQIVAFTEDGKAIIEASPSKFKTFRENK